MGLGRCLSAEVFLRRLALNNRHLCALPVALSTTFDVQSLRPWSIAFKAASSTKTVSALTLLLSWSLLFLSLISLP